MALDVCPTIVSAFTLYRFDTFVHDITPTHRLFKLVLSAVLQGMVLALISSLIMLNVNKHLTDTARHYNESDLVLFCITAFLVGIANSFGQLFTSFNKRLNIRYLIEENMNIKVNIPYKNSSQMEPVKLYNISDGGLCIKTFSSKAGYSSNDIIDFQVQRNSNILNVKGEIIYKDNNITRIKIRPNDSWNIFINKIQKDIPISIDDSCLA